MTASILNFEFEFPGGIAVKNARLPSYSRPDTVGIYPVGGLKHSSCVNNFTVFPISKFRRLIIQTNCSLRQKAAVRTLFYYVYDKARHGFDIRMTLESRKIMCLVQSFDRELCLHKQIMLYLRS